MADLSPVTLLADAERAPDRPRPATGLAAWFAPTPRNLAVWGAIVFVVSLAALLWGITAAHDIYFDETWYVPTAREWLKTGELLHPEHPPLAKLLITFSVWLFGDNPLGWRAMSALFGSITLVAVLIWTYALLRDIPRALWAVAITFFDQIVFVQARIAMLDIFLMAFCTLSLAFFTLSVKETRSSERAFRYALAMGVCLGLAGACKWSGFFLLFGLVAIQLLIGLAALWRVRFEDPRPSDFYSPGSAGLLGPGRALIAFAVAPFCAYFVAGLPQMIHEETILEFFDTHRRMFEILSGHSDGHPYASLWYTWPALWRPVWYLFKVAGDNPALWSDERPAAAVVGLANPFVVYGGEIAVLYAVGRWLVRREIDSLIVAVGFFSQFLPWAVNPKGLEFSYYFYPSIVCLGPALAVAFFGERSPARTWGALAFLVIAAGFFAFFLPILAAGIGVSPDAFSERVWTPSWR